MGGRAIPVYGSHADYICVPTGCASRYRRARSRPSAIVVFNYVTAYQMLHRTACVRIELAVATDCFVGPWSLDVERATRSVFALNTYPVRACGRLADTWLTQAAPG